MGRQTWLTFPCRPTDCARSPICSALLAIFEGVPHRRVGIICQRRAGASGKFSQAPPRNDPFVISSANRCESLEITVVMKHDQIGGPRCSRDDHVRYRQAMVTHPSQCSLQLDRGVHDLLSDRCLIQALALDEDLLEVRRRPRAVEDLEIDDRAGGDQSVLKQRAETLSNSRCRESSQRALVSEIASSQRHASDITAGSSRSRPSMDSRRSAC